MKTLYQSILSTIISIFIFYSFTILFKSEENISDNKTIETKIPIKQIKTETPIVIINKPDTIVKEKVPTDIEKPVDDYIIKSVEQAQLCLNSPVKIKDLLFFHRTRLNNLLKVKGLSAETNQILITTISKINTELKKIKDNSKVINVKKDSLGSIKKVTDTLSKAKVKTDTIKKQP